MFTATGRSAKKFPDGTFEVRVELTDDRTGKTVRFENFTGNNQAEVKQQVRQALRALRDAEEDASTSAAFVGVIIDTV